MNIEDKNNLKLIGKNEEDLKIILAYLQDNVVITSEVIEVFMEDLSKPWNVKYISKHQI